MKQFLIRLVLVMLPLSAWAAGGGGVALDHMEVDIHDQPSMQRGLQLYTNYCMGCHALGYSRYERVADDLGIPHALYEEHLIFSDAKIGELMVNAMPQTEAKVWFGTAPPDLSLVARLRGTDWLYTYLRAFYRDDKRPLGVNNAVFPDVGMPHVLAELQGLCAEKPTFGDMEIDPLTGQVMKASGCESYVSTGSMEPAEYDRAIRDLVNFLAYVGEPSRLQAERIAPFVLIFLVILFVFAYLLNREYWKDVH